MENKDTSTLKNLVNGIKERFGAAIKADPTLGTDIEKLHTLLADQVAPPAENGADAGAAPAFKEVKTKDGKILSVEGEIKAGVKINQVDPSGTATPAPDGPYELEDGTILNVTGGLITDVKAPIAEQVPAVPDPEMMAKMAAQETKIKELETKLSDSDKSRGELVAVFKKILETPIETKMSVDKEKDSVSEKEYEKMSALEKRRYWKSQESR
jgi:hypothetical protein